MIKKCVEKGYVERIEPGFYCKALISENKVFHNILNNFFDNSVINFFQTFITKENLSESEISKLKEIVDKIKDQINSKSFIVGDLFMDFVKMNISAGLIIIIMILMRKFAIKKLNYSIILSVWLLAVFRLIIPLRV